MAKKALKELDLSKEQKQEIENLNTQFEESFSIFEEDDFPVSEELRQLLRVVRKELESLGYVFMYTEEWGRVHALGGERYSVDDYHKFLNCTVYDNELLIGTIFCDGDFEPIKKMSKEVYKIAKKHVTKSITNKYDVDEGFVSGVSFTCK